MKIFENENSLKSLHNIDQINSNKISLFNLKFIHKLLNSINISLLILIFILSFLSFDSQRKWTTIYKNLFLKQDQIIIPLLIIFQDRRILY